MPDGKGFRLEETAHMSRHCKALVKHDRYIEDDGNSRLSSSQNYQHSPQLQIDAADNKMKAA